MSVCPDRRGGRTIIDARTSCVPFNCSARFGKVTSVVDLERAFRATGSVKIGESSRCVHQPRQTDFSVGTGSVVGGLGARNTHNMVARPWIPDSKARLRYGGRQPVVGRPTPARGTLQTRARRFRTYGVQAVGPSTSAAVTNVADFPGQSPNRSGVDGFLHGLDADRSRALRVGLARPRATKRSPHQRHRASDVRLDDAAGRWSDPLFVRGKSYESK